MPRINVEESIFKDERFMDLAMTLGGRQNALGALVWAWIVSQQYWSTNRSGIPKPVWEQQKVRNEIIQVGLARDEGDFYYVCGSKEQFQWLVDASDAGKRSAAKRLEKKSNHLTTTYQGAATSSSSSSSSSFSKTNTKTNTPPTPTGSIEGFTECFAEHKATLKQFGIDREQTTRDQTQIVRAIQRFGFETVRKAIVGARHEPKTKDWNPATSFSLSRIFEPDKIEKFENLGYQAAPKNQTKNKADDEYMREIRRRAGMKEED